jgi:hypothetical protein
MLPVESAAVVSAGNKRVGTGTTAETTKLDWVTQSGKIFAVANWGNNGWGIYISTDGGSSWAESYVWCCGFEEADMAVVDGYVYLTYTVGNETRLHRVSVVDAQIDADGEVGVGGSDLIFYDGFEGGSIFAWSSWQGTTCDLGTDSDGDRLDDCFETDTGVFVSDTNTGTSPNSDDTDGDYIEDGDEVLGTLGGLDLPAMGVSPLRKDILVEYDWFDDSLDCSFHTHRPTVGMVDRVTTAFANSPITNPDGSSGVNFVHDYGQGGAFSGGNLINDGDGVLTGGVNNSEFKNHKSANFAANRNGYFHYTILPHRYNTTSGSSGQAEFPGDDMIVSLYCLNSERNVAHTIVHELGHNIALGHGGYENCNYKPNYNSVMNYRYQFPGVDTDCNVGGNGVLDYSYGDRLTLNENNLNENLGVCGAPAVDWNSSGGIQTGVSHDINSADDLQVQNCGGTLTTLKDSDDWGSISFTGLSSADGPEPLAPVRVIDCDNPPPTERP